MAGFVVDDQIKEIADAMLGGGAISFAGTWYVGASTTTPAADGSSFTEPSGSGYARVAVTNNSTNFPAGSGTGTIVKTNGTAITFPQASGGSWGTPTDVGLFEASTGGTPKAIAHIGTAKAVDDGDTLTIPIGDLEFDFGPLA